MPGSTAAGVWPRPIELGLRLVSAYALLIWLARGYGRICVDALMPTFRTMIWSLDDHARVLSLAIVNDGADTVIRMTVELIQDVTINGQLFAAKGYTYSSSIGTGLILQPVIVAFGLVLAWPVRRVIEYPVRIAVTIAILSLVLVADTPLTLWANYLHTIVAPESFSLLWLWEEFLVNGGRLALGLVTAVVAIKMAGYVAEQTIPDTKVSS